MLDRGDLLFVIILVSGCIMFTLGVAGPVINAHREDVRKRHAAEERAAWEKYKTENECKKIGTIYPNQVKYECTDGYIYTRVD